MGADETAYQLPLIERLDLYPLSSFQGQGCLGYTLLVMAVNIGKVTRLTSHRLPRFVVGRGSRLSRRMMIIYRASGVGGCLKAMVADRLGYANLNQSQVKVRSKKIPEGVPIQEYYDEGHRLEEVVIERLRQDGWTVWGQQEELVLPVVGDVGIMGHIDGYTDDPIGIQKYDMGKLLEIKSMRPNLYNAFEVQEWETPGLVQRYKWQLSIYMHLSGREAVVVTVDSDPEIKDDFERRISFHRVEKPFYSLTEIKTRVLMAEAWVKRGELPVECDVINFPCSFYYLHEDAEVETIEDEAIDTLAIALKGAEKEAKEAGERAGKLKGALLEAVKVVEKDDGKGKKRIDTQRIKVVRYEQKNPPRLDAELAKADGVDLEKYKVQDKGWRMRVTIKEGGEENGND